MKRMGWGSGRGQATRGFQDPAEEIAALNEAQSQAAWVMNDDVAKAQRVLSQGTSPFHKLGYGAALFWQAVLGFDKAKMIVASAALADAEALNAEYKKAAMSGKNPATRHSKIYSDGAAFAIAEAQCQLLGAILGILKESWLESLTGLNKLRKAYFCIAGLVEAEKAYLKKHPPPAQSRTSLVNSRPLPDRPPPPVPGSTPPEIQKQTSIRRKPVQSSFDDESDDDFFDALEEQAPEEAVPNGHPVTSPSDHAKVQANHPPKARRTGSILSVARSTRSTKSVAQAVDFRLVTTDPGDLFVHSGVNMCWGILQIVLSVVPPAFRHILSMFNFRGDRDNGLSILWEATNYKENIFGSISSLVISLYYNMAVSLADILPPDAMPEARLSALLNDLRKLYPDSQLWLNEESRIAVGNRQIEKAVGILSKLPTAEPFEEMQGMRLFELGLNLMYLHRFQECADTFVDCCKFNRWSHGMYYFIVAMCYVELYRDHKHSNPALAKTYADKAKAVLESNNVTAMVKRKALLGQQLPFDEFIELKLAKWEARAKSRKCDLVEAIGVSPVEEFCYFWTGYRRMTPHDAQISHSRLLAWEATEEWADETVDERAGSAVLRAICLRNLGRIDDCKELLQKQVLCYTWQQLKSCPHAILYPIPVAHYELGVCYWQEAGGEGGDPILLRRSKEEVNACYDSPSWSLEERMTVKLMAARETFKSLQI